MKTLFLVNIISSNTVYRLNEYIRLNQKHLGKTNVYFCAQTEQNRLWTVKEKPEFSFKVLRYHEIRIKGKDLFTYFINPTILRDLERTNPDRIIIMGWDQLAYQVALVWGKFRGKQITLWSGSTINENSWRRKIMAIPVRLIVKLADDYVAYGQRSKGYLVTLGAEPTKIEIFLNDVNGKYFHKQAQKLVSQRNKLRKQFGVRTTKNFIYVGQLIERKGIGDLLQAYEKFIVSRGDWGLVIVGYGQLETELKDLVWRRGLSNVYFFSAVDQYELPPYYALANVLVLPSHVEVWGLVVNEALYSGLKVIVSDRCGCVPDLVKPGNNGYLYRTGSVPALVKAMRATLALTA